MEANRLAARAVLSSVMEAGGETPELYFQPPETVKMNYPCVVYHFKSADSRYADDLPYKTTVSFEATYITRSPVSKVPLVFLKTLGVSFDRYYVAEGLHHYVYRITSSLKEDGNA